VVILLWQNYSTPFEKTGPWNHVGPKKQGARLPGITTGKETHTMIQTKAREVEKKEKQALNKGNW